MTETVIASVFAGIAVISTGLAWWFAIQTRRSVRRIDEIRRGGPR